MARRQTPRYGKENPISPGLQAVRNTYGMILDAPGGARKIQDAEAFLTSQWNNPASPGYRPTSPSAFGTTPMNVGGQRFFFNNATGQVTDAGQTADIGQGPGPIQSSGGRPNAGAYPFAPIGGGGRPNTNTLRDLSNLGQGAIGGKRPRTNVGRNGGRGGGYGRSGGPGGMPGELSHPYMPQPGVNPDYNSGIGPGSGGLGGFPQLPPQPPNFLPMTPQYEASQRGATDALSAAEMNYGIGSQQVNPLIDLYRQRMGTDVGYANKGLLENLAERGISNSGVYPELYQRDIATPYGRSMQDLALGGVGQYSDLASQLGGARLGYGQNMMEALLQNAMQEALNPSLGTPYGGYTMAGGLGGGRRRKLAKEATRRGRPGKIKFTPAKGKGKGKSKSKGRRPK